MDEIETERKVINDDSPETRCYKEVHSLCMRRLKEGVAADQVVVALLYNAFRGLMERYEGAQDDGGVRVLVLRPRGTRSRLRTS